MTQEQEKNILEQYLKGINLNILWALIVCTAVSVGSVLSVYYGFKSDLEKTNMRIDFLEKQFDKQYND